jgi:phospholipid-translocating P-type ATPase (flippase)
MHGHLPPSLPDNWPDSTQEEVDERPTRKIKFGSGTEQEFWFRNNFVKTSKYEWYNFLFKFLMEEFNPMTKMANVYFLLVAVLQTIPAISNTFGIPTTLMPLLFVVLVDGIFAFIEDRARHKADDAANSSITHRFNYETGKYENTLWLAVEVGDLVLLNTRDVIPADLVILACHEKYEVPTGMCYVETKSLDGETNLKIRNVVPPLFGKVRTPEQAAELLGDVEMEHPNKRINSFTGTIDVGGSKDAIQPGNILLRGCVLRNCEWIVGLVVNTGHDTKIMMSNTETPSKSSVLERRASVEIARIVGLLALVCFIGTTGATAWNNDHLDGAWYLDWDPSPGGEWFVKFFYFFLLHATFIPVSLYVTMTVMRFFQSYFMNNDLNMYYEPTDTPALVRTMTLNEELGQISHIFSDKTGTLTCNIMDFKKCSIAGEKYGRGLTEIGKAALKLEERPVPEEELRFEELAFENAKDHVTFFDPFMTEHLGFGGQGADEIQTSNIHAFFECLSLCHEVIVERVGEEMHLSASSPDDEALVCAADYFGHSFVDRVEGKALISTYALKRCENGGVMKDDTQKVGEEMWDVLESLDFTSKRKRMSVCVQSSSDLGVVRVISKGADSSMLHRLSTRNPQELIDKTVEDMDAFADEGLRCLVIAMKEISIDEFRDWQARYKEATTNIAEIDKRKNEEENLIDDLMDEMEQDLLLVGATAIEDRLQRGVPTALAKLAVAGIKLWVLTGDKETTAINIGAACNLVQPEHVMKRIIINQKRCPTKDDVVRVLTEENRLLEDAIGKGGKVQPVCLVIDGPTLLTIMDNAEDKNALLTFSSKCHSVVACRVSPDQKRQLVNMIKDGVPGVRTLAIGDGANDVAMIQAAHIGVGISGQEGLQAVNASDYAIAQFRFLQQLTLVHGRYNYRRMAKMVNYMFYKNIYMSIAQFFFALTNGFSGQKMYTEAAIQFFNLFFTSLPIILMGVLDRDVQVSTSLRIPRLYLPCIEDFFFRPTYFWGNWMLWAVIDALFMAIIPIYANSLAGSVGGESVTFWENGLITYTAIVIAVNLKMFQIQLEWYWFNIVISLLSIILWFMVAAVVDATIFVDFDWHGTFRESTSTSAFWLIIFFLIGLVNGKDFFLKAYARETTSQLHHAIQEAEIYPDKAAYTVEQIADLMDEDHMTTKEDSSKSKRLSRKWSKFTVPGEEEEGKDVEMFEKKE